MILPLSLILLLALLFLPQWYVGHVMRRYARTLPRFTGTGAELARQLLDRFSLPYVGVELTEQGDHYDPETRTVRLSRSHYEDHSLTAIAVAAHEVGHALQDRDGFGPMRTRTRLIRLVNTTEKLGAGLMLAWPVVTVLSRSPRTGLVFALLGALSFLGSALVHLVTLPVEWDASFGRALPILVEGDYIRSGEQRAVRGILRAAALTYVAASLGSLLNLGRWLSVLRR